MKIYRYKFLREKLIILRDPVLNISEIKLKKSQVDDIQNN